MTTNLLPLDTTMETFGEWLAAELRKRDWSMSKMGQMCEVTHAAISRVISGENKPSPELCKSIAHAFGMAPVTVFRKAGLLPITNDDEEFLEELTHQLRQMSYRDRVRFLRMIKAWVRSGAPEEESE